MARIQPVDARFDRPRLLRASAETVGLFRTLHSEAHGFGWCQCVAWWVEGFEGFEGFGERTSKENRVLRDELFEAETFDGYFLVEGDPAAPRPLAWAQVAPRDTLGRVARVFGRSPDPGAYALGCLAVVPRARRQGVARALLEQVLTDLPGRGATSLEAFPRELEGETDQGEIWNGPLGLYRALGFRRIADAPPRIVMEIRFVGFKA